MNKLANTTKALLAGSLLFAAWPVSPLTFIIFIAWVPLLMVADNTTKKLSFFWYTFLTTLVWNVLTTWWIWNSTDIGSIAAMVANSLLMTLPWWGYFIFKTNYGKRTGYISLVFFWLLFEYIHLNWQLSWPWLTLGNVFAQQINWIQWYEFTGTSGGSLWILLVNILLYDTWIQIRNKSVKPLHILILTVVWVLPFVISFLVKPETNKNPVANSSNVIIVQPNIDPYSQKFDQSTISTQVQTFIQLSEQALDTNTRLVVWPETALPAAVWQDELKNTSIYAPVFDFANRHRNITIVTGAETFKSYGAEKLTTSARFNENDNSYYDVFNAAVAIKSNSPLQFYNKSKLVPGVETLPDFLLWMAPVFEKFGGTASGYGKSAESAVFIEPGNPYIPAPIICYESIYGEYVSTYVQKGANILTIITNDGWWGNTPGHKQHLAYARLRAIETRKWVARSANTGISAVIDNAGAIQQTQPWDTAAYIKAAIPPVSGETFYVAHGDIISTIAMAIGILLIVWNIFMQLRKKSIIKQMRK